MLVVHGGAGAARDSPARSKRKRRVLAQALRRGAKLLAAGRSAVDAVEAAIRLLEDSPLFNAGRGGTPNRRGFVELDASIMDGHARDAGAVAAVRRIKNPISAARAAMQRSPHVMFVDRGAVAFAKRAGLKLVKPSYFLVPRPQRTRAGKDKGKPGGTVGAVALDRCGHLAAGTSTGGYNRKMPGRVGDSPVIGAGTYASDRCAVSATGHGEYFIRYAAAHEICALMAHRHLPVGPAARRVIAQLRRAGGKGGVIALGRRGRPAWPYSSEAMMRGIVDQRGVVRVGVKRAMTVER